jgi:hypothetical protein
MVLSQGTNSARRTKRGNGEGREALNGPRFGHGETK